MMSIVLSTSYVLIHLILTTANAGDIITFPSLQMIQFRNSKIKQHAQGPTSSDRISHPDSRAHTLM